MVLTLTFDQLGSILNLVNDDSLAEKSTIGDINRKGTILSICINHLWQQWPVGHGFFHTASINAGLNDKIYRYVYDCGSVARTLVEGQIERYAKNEELEFRELELDMLVLSHFHIDHINGLPFLLTRFKVKKLVLPFLTNDFALVALAALAANGPHVWTEFSGLVLEPEAWLRDRGQNETEISLIRSDSPPEGPESRHTDVQPGTISLPAGAISHHETGTIGVAGNVIWDFKFYSQEHWGRYFMLLGALNEKFNPTTEQELFDSLKDSAWIAANHMEVSEVFRSLGSSSQNGTTLCMYSGPSYGKQVHGYFRRTSHGLLTNAYFHEYRRHWLTRVGWLATGDAELRDQGAFKDFSAHYKDYIPAVDTLTVPHHGSIDNYCGELGDIAQQSLLTSDHVIDPHDHHPCSLVMTNMRIKCIPIFIVTRDVDSTVFSASTVFLD